MSGFVSNGYEASHCAPDSPQVLIFNVSVLCRSLEGKQLRQRAEWGSLSVCTDVMVDAMTSHVVQVHFSWCARPWEAV